jgi:mannose-6-phosphate isomerase-like protein (cupin superfamily)
MEEVFYHKTGKEAEKFIPPLHHKCISQWCFKKGEPSHHISIAKSDFEIGGHGDWHSHADSDQTYYVVSGNARVWMDSEENWIDIGKGELILFPKGKNHKVKNIGLEPLSVIAINTPAIKKQL